MLAAVESLDARVISRLPLRPRRAGTMIRISDTSLEKGSQGHKKMQVLTRPKLYFKISGCCLFKILILWYLKTFHSWTWLRTSPAATMPRPAITKVGNT